jgi:hypothetical protein
MSMKNSNDTIGNRTRDLRACSTVPLRMIGLLAKKPVARVTKEALFPYWHSDWREREKSLSPTVRIAHFQLGTS